MPRSLKLYIIGVVALGAVALGAATLWFPFASDVKLPVATLPEGAQILLGVAFWTLLTVVASAFWDSASRRERSNSCGCLPRRPSCRRLGSGPRDDGDS
jgi:hypothetical protein